MQTAPQKNKKSQLIQRRRPKQKRAKEKYDAVLDACTQLLAEKGYAKTSMLELSLESGVAVPTIYQYFTNKEEIFQRWFERLSTQVFASLSLESESVVEGGADGEIVEAFIFKTLSVVSSQRESAQGLLIDMPQTLSSRMIASLEEETLNFVEGMFGNEIEQSVFEREKLLVLIRLILGYVFQVILNAEREPNIAFETQELSKVVKSYLGMALTD